VSRDGKDKRGSGNRLRSLLLHGPGPANSPPRGVVRRWSESRNGRVRMPLFPVLGVAILSPRFNGNP
jgi:hypothetical protein